MATISKKTEIHHDADAALGLHRYQSQSSSVDSSDNSVVLVNVRGIVTYVSPRINATLGQTPERIVGSHLRDLAHPDDLEALRWAMGSTGEAPIEAPIGTLRARFRRRCQDGSWRWFEGTGTNLLQVTGVESVVINIRDGEQRDLAPRSDLSELSTPGHFVQFYETDSFLLDSIASYVTAGLRAGDSCVLIATKAHQEGLSARMEANGFDLAVAQTRGEYYWLDAAETLARVMVDGMPDPERFTDVVKRLIMHAGNGDRHVRSFGEMVALLWTEGNHAAAIRLEELWNDLYRTVRNFSLLCAYSMYGFAGGTNGAQLAEICS